MTPTSCAVKDLRWRPAQQVEARGREVEVKAVEEQQALREH